LASRPKAIGVVTISRQHQHTTRSVAVLYGQIVEADMRVAAAVLLVLVMVLVTAIAIMACVRSRKRTAPVRGLEQL
jgi:hypothetical protein